MPALEPGLIFLPSTAALGVGASALSMSALNQFVALNCQIPKTGTVTGLKFMTSTVTTGGTITGTIETIANAIPTGTLYDANATGTVVVANSDDSVEKTITFAGNVSVTRGDFVSVKLEVTAGTPSSLTVRTSATLQQTAFPHLYHNVSGNTWSQSHILVKFIYDTEELCPVGMFYMNVNANVSISSSTTPDEVGTKFVAPYSASVRGVYMRGPTSSGAQDCDYILYDSSDNVIASKSVAGTNVNATTGLNNIQFFIFDSNVNILKGRTYRVVMKPTTTTTWTNAIQTVSNPLNVWDGVTNPAYTYRTDAGAWTDDTTRVVPVGVILEKVYQPGGSFL